MQERQKVKGEKTPPKLKTKEEEKERTREGVGQGKGKQDAK